MGEREKGAYVEKEEGVEGWVVDYGKINSRNPLDRKDARIHALNDEKRVQ